METSSTLCLTTGRPTGRVGEAPAATSRVSDRLVGHSGVVLQSMVVEVGPVSASHVRAVEAAGVRSSTGTLIDESMAATRIDRAL